jgi:hypothetical protein
MSIAVLILVVAALAVLFWLLRTLGSGSLPMKLVIVAAFVGLLIFGWFGFKEISATRDAIANETKETIDLFASIRPTEEPQGEFVTSARCLECHEENHASWHASYHRTMTQVARADRVMGSFSNQVVSIFGGKEHYQLFKHMGVPWVRRVPDADSPGPMDESEDAVPIVMTTGSHHMQAYWMPTGRGRLLSLMPLMYMKETQEWIPRSSAFLRPPTDETLPEVGRWNTTCIKCHTTDGRMNLPVSNDDPLVDSKASEFGISCESCHGPGQLHIEHQSVVAAGTAPEGKDPIVNPGTAPHQLSSQICGGCHSVNSNHGDPDDWTPYRAGDDLESDRVLFDYTELTHKWMVSSGGMETNGVVNVKAEVDSILDQWFWKDGTPRVSGREYSGLRKSACFTRGEMACISCHSLHPNGLDSAAQTEWANDLLHQGMDGDRSCLQCHAVAEFASIKHTRHAAESDGSRCMNCHMPYTTYGLLKAIRSHTVLSPSVSETVEMGRPNACNLCHLDKTLKWTADRMNEWYDQPVPELPIDESRLAAGALWTLRGDAGLRALTAWHMGWKPAQEASGEEWMIPYLAELMDDPYDAVRYVTRRSIRSRAAYQEFKFDFLQPSDKRRERAAALLTKWRGNVPPFLKGREDLLFDESGQIIRSDFQRLLKFRDKRDMTLAE